MLTKAAKSTVFLKPSYNELNTSALTPEAEKELEAQVLLLLLSHVGSRGDCTDTTNAQGLC